MKSFRNFARIALHAQLMPILEAGEETLVGGQAVMEGVMMRAPHSYCVAVRKANGEFVTEQAPLHKVSEKYPIFKLPILRGLGTLGQAMQLGMKALQFSANAALDEAPAGEVVEKKKSTEIPGWMMAANMLFMFGFFIFMYKFLPLLLATQLGKWSPALSGRITMNFVDGGIRILLFLGFLFAISLTKDIQRVFQYHGAEHKVVFNFESGKPVTIENAQKFVTFHPRCGTSFMLVVMVIALVVYAFLPVDNFWLKFGLRVALLPFIAGLSYELIRFAAKNQDSFLMKAMTAPGLWLQRITTKQPDDTQAQVAIHALEGAMELEKSQGGELVIA
ncbi:MAG TPA: DUF1385 domain-containing protein [Bryobacteraceae bacterium]